MIFLERLGRLDWHYFSVLARATTSRMAHKSGTFDTLPREYPRRIGIGEIKANKTLSGWLSLTVWVYSAG